jgi:hypothetical protein
VTCPSYMDVDYHRATKRYMPDGRTQQISRPLRDFGSRGGAFGLANGYGLENRRDKNLLSSTSSRPVLGPTQPPIQWIPGTFSLEVKRQQGDADHSPPTSAEVKKTWVYTSTPPYVFMA